MTVSNVKIIVGYRLLFSETEWETFLLSIKNYLETKNLVEKCDKEYYRENKIDFDFQNLEWFLEDITKKIPNSTTNFIGCCHIDEGMDRMIDIGFPIGTFNCSGEHKESYVPLMGTIQSINNAQEKSFIGAMKKMFIWKYVVNKDGAELLGQANDCWYCN